MRDKGSIDWGVERYNPIWQITASRVTEQEDDVQFLLALDISARFESRYRIAAETTLSHKEFYSLVEREERIKGMGDHRWYGYSIENFQSQLRTPEHSPRRWHVSNTYTMCPYAQRTDTRDGPPIAGNEDVRFSIEFTRCPYTIFKRYWRKPVKLKSKLHYNTKRKHIHLHTAPVYSLFAQTAFYDVRRFGAFRFSLDPHCYFYNIDKKATNELMEWMKKYIRHMYIFSDYDTVFVDPKEEFMFTSEFML